TLAERVRRQLEGWLDGAGWGWGPHLGEEGGDGAPPGEKGKAGWGYRPTGGLTLVRLAPDEVVPDEGRQLGFWGGDRAADERAARALARVQALLGPEAVATAVLTGGRAP